MRLSKNFTLSEMTKSNTATRLGIWNAPTQGEIDNLQYLASTVMQPTRDKFGRMRVNSGYRSVELCEVIGSNKYSNHCHGMAVDFESVEGISNFEVLEWIAENCEFKELIAEYFDVNVGSAGWVHVAANRGDNRGVIKLKDADHNYEIVTLDQLRELYKA